MIGLRKKQEEARKNEDMEKESTEKMEVGEGEGNVETKPAGRGRGRGRGRGVSIFGVKGTKSGKSNARRLRPGEIRVQKDVSELDGGDCAQAHFPDPNDLMNFYVTVSPDDGYWKGYKYKFEFKVPDMYPHEPPKVKCLNKIYHPNIDTDGNVCLNILRADWKPVLDINAIIYGLIVLFVQPNADDPLNHKAAEKLRKNPQEFLNNVQRSLRGYSVDGISYPAAIRASSKD
mmetsp:Transcript_19787/g.25289  ORF Transcript_19787/g.25289 Transcript_19787/m.25289 type:complete len:231 (-) Transcript_19787:396-1088(-)|eukprot:CAMPEP_0204832360 /NCGR_PEP_ID=MMETSP1346-20131115/13384_1 /ASSEMBLY_ACC=CAM_ASM_000771 /TAXON_ID=215587 /ORGANISM="Aplanochytrium stocchinoi, Strain GSBS06" /LENGTH=230 /DNA_ID=CAMNT_0051964117 /DNA_START=310 /DNA_END=1002 /DNA_ORIENTATION=-